ncbi:hypothetical protein ACJX0J_007417, partial [Zea mays]
ELKIKHSEIYDVTCTTESSRSTALARGLFSNIACPVDMLIASERERMQRFFSKTKSEFVSSRII